MDIKNDLSGLVQSEKAKAKAFVGKEEAVVQGFTGKQVSSVKANAKWLILGAVLGAAVAGVIAYLL